MSDQSIGASGIGCVCRRGVAILWQLFIFHKAGEVTGDVQALKLSAAEAVDQRVQEAVKVGQNHEAVKGLCSDVIWPVLHPNDEQRHPGNGARKEAEGEHHHDGHDQEHSPP